MADFTATPEQVVEDESNDPGQISAGYNPAIQQTNRNNTLTMWGNKDTMNLNHLVLENILQSPYYRNKLVSLKTFHEIVDEIYYNVSHLEPWEKGTRKTTGQTGMCGGVRGVGAGGVVSTPFCILFKLFTMKLTRKQLGALLNHADSPYIRGLGFMYIRFCLPPVTFWDWYEPYLEDEEEIDPKAGTGDTMTIGQMCKIFLTKLEWYSTLFPRIPVPVQKELDVKMREHNKKIYNETKSNVVEEESSLQQQQQQQFQQPQQQQKSSRSGERGRSRDRSADVRNERGRNVDHRNDAGAHQRKSKSPPMGRRKRSRSNSRKRNRSRSKDRQHKKSSDQSKSREHRHHHRRGDDKDGDEKRRHHKKSRKHHHRRHHSKSGGSPSESRRTKKHRGNSSPDRRKSNEDAVAETVVERKKADVSPPPAVADHNNESREEGELMDEGKVE